VVDDRVQNVDEEVCEKWHFKISELSCEFKQISRTISARLSQLG
jgi:hypothetical protein